MGNDVVDLADAEALPGARHARFDARVFAASELRGLERGSGRDRMRWILWAAKESAFKVARRGDPAIVFSPSRFVVSLGRPSPCERHGRRAAGGQGGRDAAFSGLVRHRERHFPVRVELSGDCVHAVATEAAPDLGVVLAGVCGGGASSARALAIAELAPRLGVTEQELRIERRGRIPQLIARGDPARATLSLSHHGRFAAFACLLPGGAGPGGSR